MLRNQQMEISLKSGINRWPSCLYSGLSESNRNQGESVFKTSGCGARKKISKRQIIIVSQLALFAFVTAIPWACGQAPKQPVSQEADLSVTPDEVSLDLVVHDKKNKPVFDLKQGEIAVTDGGSPVTLNSFRLVSGEQKSERLITLVFDRPGPVAGNKHGTDPSLMKTTRDAAAKILKMIPASGFSVSVLTVEGRLRLQAGFTSDRKALAQAIDAATQPVNAKTWNGSTPNEAEKQLLAEAQTGADPSGKPVSAKVHAQDMAMISALKGSSRIAQDQHLRPFLAGLLALAQSQQQITQRKALIYCTSLQGGQIDSRTSDAIKSIVGSANRAGESIYVVDLNSNDLFSVSQELYAGHDRLLEKHKDIEAANMEIYEGDMKHLAEGTGGSYINLNRMQKSLAQMIQDMTTYYVASYHSPVKEFDGQFRSVGVKPLRSGLKIRSKSGYLALPPPAVAGNSQQPFELPLLKILSQSPLPTDLTFRTAILRMEDRPEGNVNTLAIEAPLSDLEIREDSSTNLYSAHLTIVANIKDKTGKVVEHFSADIPRRGALKDIDKTKYEAISMVRYFAAEPGQYLLEAAILDQNSGKAGAQRITFEIPKAAAMPSLSDMVLVQQTEPIRLEDDPSDPLRHGSDKVTPNLSGQLSPHAKDVSVFFITHADQHAAGTATLNIHVLRDNKLLGGAPMIANQDGGSEFSSYLIRFSIDPPVDGQYEVKVILSQGGKTAQAGATFTLAGFQPNSANAADPDLPALGTMAHPAGPLVISFPVNPIQPPPPDELQSILADARHYALDYRSSLPNYMCKQITNRSVDPSGSMRWKHIDTLTERLTYLNNVEDRTLVEVEANGYKSNTYFIDTKGMLSTGEFGVVLSGLFLPKSKAEFTWAKTGMLGGETVQVLDYRVARENSTLNLRSSSNEVITVGYHGQVFIDSATRSVRRITQEADDVPNKCLIHATSVSVDYDYVMINKHDYLLPIGAEIMLRKGHRETDLNEIEFRNFRRFGSNVRILDNANGAKP
jgi:VWFA-related protein